MVRQTDISSYIEAKFFAQTDALIQPEFLINDISAALGLAPQFIQKELHDIQVKKGLVKEESAIQ